MKTKGQLTMIDKIKSQSCAKLSIGLFFVIVLFSLMIKLFSGLLPLLFAPIFFLCDVVVSLASSIFSLITIPFKWLMNLPIDVDQLKLITLQVADFLYGYLIVFEVPFAFLVIALCFIGHKKFKKGRDYRLSLLPDDYTDSMRKKALKCKRSPDQVPSKTTLIISVILVLVTIFMFSIFKDMNSIVGTLVSADDIQLTLVHIGDRVRVSVAQLMHLTIAILLIPIITDMSIYVYGPRDYVVSEDDIPNITDDDTPSESSELSAKDES